ncbi:SRPBCC family protein [bacterium SCSIO 12741]|nr:SRPBCC family protein [bacterium SCSIO 12741]
MPKVHVNRSIQMDASPEKVYQLLSDFNNWTPWSPWLITEPDAKVTVSDDAKFYEWDGNRVGSGNMRIVGEKENSRIDLDLTFLKPWKSTAKVWFDIKAKGQGSEVSWGMDTSLPFIMFWMKKTMSAMIGMDYDRGLNMLKEFIEAGTVSSKLDFKGETQFDGCSYVGVKTSCSIQEVGSKMQADLARVGEFAQQNQDLEPGMVFSIYHKWDPVKGLVEYTSGISVKKLPGNLPAGLVSGEIPNTRIYSVEHHGAYHYLGNAWSALYNMQRSKVFKAKKGVHPFEIYHTDPHSTPDKEHVTSINFAVK